MELPEPVLLGRDPGVREPRWDGDINVKRLRDGVFGVVGGREERVEERGGVLGGSINVVLADNSSPNISFLINARYMLSASSSMLLETHRMRYTSLGINFSCVVFLSRL